MTGSELRQPRRVVPSANLRSLLRRPGRGQWFSATIVWLLISALCSAPYFVSVPPVSQAQVALSDWLFVRDDGPRLGARSARGDVVLVVMDERSATELGHRTTTADEDFQLYKNLLAAGAVVTAEDRSNFLSTDLVERENLISTIPDSKNRVLLNYATDQYAQQNQLVGLADLARTAGTGAVAIDPFNVPQQFDAEGRARYYALVTNFGDFNESLALKLARRLLGLPTDSDISRPGGPVRTSGIAALWIGMNAVNATAEVTADAARYSPAPYPLGPHTAVPWTLNYNSEAVFHTPHEAPATLWINYAEPAPQRISYVDVLKGRISPERIRGKAVVVTDDFGGPCGRDAAVPDRCPPMADATARVTDQILDGAYLSTPPVPVRLGLVFLVALLGVAAQLFLRRWWALGALAGAVVLYMCGSVLAYRAGTFPDLVQPVAALLLTALIPMRLPTITDRDGVRSVLARSGPWARLSLLVAVVCSSQIVWPLTFVDSLRYAAADRLFVTEDGARLGYHPVDSRFLKILDDDRTVRDLGSERTVSQYLDLYRRLLDDGAAYVYDRRLIPADKVPAIVAGLEQMPGARGHLGLWYLNSFGDPSPTKQQVRDWFPPDPLPDSSATTTTSAQLTIGANGRFRYYPLVAAVNLDSDLVETAPVRMGRAASGERSPSDLAGVLQKSGILSAWAHNFLLSPDDRALWVGPNGHPPQPYPIGAGIPWVYRQPAETEQTIAPAALWIAYTSPMYAYPKLSLSDVLTGGSPASAFRGKVIAIDTDPGALLRLSPTAADPRPLKDVRSIDSDLQIAQDIALGQALSPLPGWLAFALLLAMSLTGMFAFAVLQPLRAAVVAAIGLVGYLLLSIVLYRLDLFPDLVMPPLALAVGGLAGVRRAAALELEARHVYDLFGRYVPRTVVAELVRHPDKKELALASSKREITVLFADIRGFTRYSDPRSPEDTFSNLNTILEVLVDAAFAEEGTVDKYIGDAIMVIWNAPLDQVGHTSRAVRAGRRMLEATKGGELKIGIGIHVGEAIVGGVGTSQRLAYTAIGSTVNLASRLSGIAGPSEMVLSEEAWGAAPGLVVAEARHEVHVKNIDRALTVYVTNGEVPRGD